MNIGVKRTSLQITSEQDTDLMFDQYESLMKRMKHEDYTRSAFEDRQEDASTLFKSFMEGKVSFFEEDFEKVSYFIHGCMQQAALEPNSP